jgi:hypothetical protein
MTPKPHNKKKKKKKTKKKKKNKKKKKKKKTEKKAQNFTYSRSVQGFAIVISNYQNLQC